MREWLKEIRKKLGLSQHEAAKAAGISQSYYAAVEIGTRNVPVSTAKKIAAALGFAWTEFYKDDEKTSA
ncbi:MAG: helix-turn-helix transcriptional regulator [Ruminococcaceae bacterium]|nr:helix-turn-helix transcriptional regulator [Oscillospiraceae bacterium]